MMHSQAGFHLQRTTHVLLLFVFFLQPYVFSQTGLSTDTFEATDTSSPSSAVSTSFPPSEFIYVHLSENEDSYTFLRYGFNGSVVLNISVESDQVVQLGFERLDLHCYTRDNDYHYDYCRCASFDIYDGAEQKNESRIWSYDYCNNYYWWNGGPGLTTSFTNNVLLVLTIRNATYSYMYISMFYKAVNPDLVKRNCGGHYNSLTGTITSPDFPNNYTDLLICEWLISLDFAYRISLYIYEYDIENSPNCKYDSLQIRDGDNSSSPVLNTICGSYYWYPQIASSSDSNLLLRFVSNWNTTGSGFKANWSIECDKYISNENGSLKSPNYPSTYPHFMQCTYYFYSLQPGQRIIFTFIDIDLQEEYANGSCINDYVEIIDHPRWVTESPTIKRFCGNTLPEEVVSYSDTTVRFISDGTVAGHGYHLRYHRSLTRDCGSSILTGEEGIIKSPGFPGSYPDHINCTWTIQVSSGRVIHLAFDSMNMGWWNTDEGERCLWDWWRGVLQVFDGPAQENGTSVGIYCGNVAPLPIISNGSSMTLVFTSYYNYDMWTGFKATYTALENFTVFDDCGGNLTGGFGQFVSPNYPKAYPNNSECVWIINGEPGFPVRVSFLTFSVEDTPSCHKDALELRDGNNEHASRLDRLCGDHIPLDVTSRGDTIYAKFISDVRLSQMGFNATWRSVCEQTFTWSSGEITSPSHQGSIQCLYFIEQWEGYVVRLTFSDFRMGDDCEHNYIEVKDGGFEGSPVLGPRFCDRNKPTVLTSTQNLMFIKFVSNGSSPLAAFRASYTRHVPSCDTTYLTEKQGSFASPSYPNNYPNGIECTWVVTTDPNRVIQLTFHDFVLEGSAYCPWDWITIQDGSNFLGKYCGVSIPETITSKSTSLTVTFRSDSIIEFQGFSASYFTYDPSTDELFGQHDMYPFGEENGDDKLGENDASVEKVKIKTGFPVGKGLQHDVFVANKGLVTFGKQDRGKGLKLKTNKMMICPYHSDIGARNGDGGVFYQLHTDNQTILDKASSQVREFTQLKTYTASLVLVVTWDRVSHINNSNPAVEHATVQLALISNGMRSFAIVYYRSGAMNWPVMIRKPLVIGFANGNQNEAYEIEYSRTSDAFTSMDTIKGNTGRRGMWIYDVGDSYSADQVCQDWYKRNLPLNKERQKGFQRLPQCPCSRRFLWGHWQFSHWRDGYKSECYRMTLGNSRSVAPYGKECCYMYDWSSWWWWWSWASSGQYVSDGPHAGSATAYNPAFWSLHNDYIREDREAHDVCCFQTTSPEYCKKYHELRPVGQCTTRIPFRFPVIWGDPHIKTLDGGEYTFNGLGEYVMIVMTRPDLNFTLQGRTGLAETENGTITNATVFKAFGAEENGVRVFAELDPNTNNTMIMYADDVDYTRRFREEGTEFLEETEDFLLRRTNDSFVVIFASEIQLTISIGYKSLEISLSMPIEFRSQTRGLLGNFNDNITDEFILPNGTIMNANISERQIFEIFGPAWAVTESNTVMRYGPREGPKDYTHADFRPLFLDEQPPATKQAAQELCGATNLACIYDYIATGSTAIANATKDTAATADETEKISKNTVPLLLYNSTLLLISGESVIFTLNGHDPDLGDSLRYYLMGDSGGVQLNSYTGDVNYTANLSKPANLSFYAVDSSNVRSPVQDVPVIICSGCSNHGTCNFSNAVPHDETYNVQVAGCTCLPSWTGPDCSEDYDACEENPCSSHQECTDLSPLEQGEDSIGYKCSGCFEGYAANAMDSTRCEDIDECLSSATNNCSGICENLPGSYTCSCPDGFRLNVDGSTCDDINECAEHTDTCRHACVNSNGSYLCQCQEGYILSDAKGDCELSNPTSNGECEALGCSHGCSVQTEFGDIVPFCFCFAGFTPDPHNSSACIDRDECTEGVCSQSCINTIGSFTCTCYSGNRLGSDQRTCMKCSDMRYGPDCRSTCECNGRGVGCHPVQGCVCQDGWTGSQCQTDVNECVETPDACPAGELCSNTNGSFSCLCPAGYTRAPNGKCIDVDECAEESTQNNCNRLEHCINVPGTFVCTCKPGYQRVNGNCTDVNECSNGGGVCQQRCVNVQGSYNCECYYGYRLNADRKTCSQVGDVCAEFEGLKCDHGCTISDDDRGECICNIGYKIATDRQTCLDIDECMAGTAGCSHECTNTENGFYCSCPLGMMLDNGMKNCTDCPTGKYGENCTRTCACGLGTKHCDVRTGCVCLPGWTGDKCDRDVNECDNVTVQYACQARNAACFNFRGGYKCQCHDGYSESTGGMCNDIDECISGPCQQMCENVQGSYRCLCHAGFTFSLTTSQCEDVNECTPPPSHACTQRCENIAGSYRCSCNIAGYVLDNDGVTCLATTTCIRTDCPTENGGCSEENCFCNSGYELNEAGNVCEPTDVDMCSFKPCEQLCTETNNGRTFTCSCNHGYLLNNDGRTCRSCPEGRYGDDCNQSCKCSTTNTASCNTANGSCTCKAGWEGVTCELDVNECNSPLAITCPSHSHCANINGSYLCPCDAGFVKTENRLCEECDANFYGENCAQTCRCSTNSKSCNSVHGTCVCKAGWNGDLCESDVDECAEMPRACSGRHQECINTQGSYRCVCSSGFDLNRDNICTDKNECLDEDTNNCLQVCTNTNGSFHCSCDPGYSGSGNDCKQLRQISLQVTVDISVPPHDLASEYSAMYKTWTQLATSALFNRLNSAGSGLLEIVIGNLRSGSLIIDAVAVLKDDASSTAISILTANIVNLHHDHLAIGNLTGRATVSINGIDMDHPTSLCEIFVTIDVCKDVTQCQIVDGLPTCRTPTSKETDDLAIIIGVCVAVPAALVIVGLVICFFCVGKKPSKIDSLEKTMSQFQIQNEISSGKVYESKNRNNGWTKGP